MEGEGGKWNVPKEYNSTSLMDTSRRGPKNAANLKL